MISLIVFIFSFSNVDVHSDDWTFFHFFCWNLMIFIILSRYSSSFQIIKVGYMKLVKQVVYYQEYTNCIIFLFKWRISDKHLSGTSKVAWSSIHSHFINCHHLVKWQRYENFLLIHNKEFVHQPNEAYFVELFVFYFMITICRSFSRFSVRSHCLKQLTMMI